MESVRKEVEGYTHSVAHAVMNIDENLSVTENLFLPDSLEDWVHGWAEKSLKDLFKAFF